MLKKTVFLILILVVLYAIFHHSEPEPPSAPDTEVRETAPSRFAGYDCTGDCSGHQAGYDWAEEKGIDDEDDCETAGEHSNSPSFAEGCKAFVNGGDATDDDDKDDGEHSAISVADMDVSA